MNKEPITSPLEAFLETSLTTSSDRPLVQTQGIWKRRMATFLLLFAICTGAMWYLEALIQRRQQSAFPTKKSAEKAKPSKSRLTSKECARRSDGSRPEGCRVVLLMLDSLRDKTAAQAKIMPQLHKLKKQGVYGQLRSCSDHVTVPCLRASMEGRYQSSVFSIILNFSASAASHENVLWQAKQVGGQVYLNTLKYGFTQFRSAAKKIDIWTSDSKSVRQVLAAYRSGKYDILAVQLIDGDHAAHGYGVHHPRYRSTWRHIDSQIKKIADAVSTKDTLLIYGDHGHDASGTHRFGKETPSYYLVRGPRFLKGKKLDAEIKDVRYFVSTALGLPIPANYQGRYHPQALRAPTPAQRAMRLHNTRSTKGHTPLHDMPDFWAALFMFGLLGAIWLLLQLRLMAWSNTASLWKLCLFLGLLPLPALIAHQTWLFVVTCLVLSGILGTWLLAWGRGRIAWFAMAGGLAGFALWAQLLYKTRPGIHGLWWRHQMSYVFLAGCAVAFVGRFLPLRVALHLLWVPALFLFLPTVYPYGAMAMVFPALFGFALLLFFYPLRDPQTGALSHAQQQRIPSLFLAKCLAATAFFALLLFAYVESQSFLFMNFLGWRLYMKGNPNTIITCFVLAKCALYTDLRWQGWKRIVPLLGALLIGYLEYKQSTWGGFALAGTAGLALFVLRQRYPSQPGSPQRQALRHLLWLLLLQGALLHSVRISFALFVQLNILLGCIALLARATNGLQSPRLAQTSAILLAVCGSIATLWMTIHWGLGNLEWTYVYDWMSPARAEALVGLVSVMNVVKYLLPLFILRLLLKQHFGPQLPDIMHSAHIWIGLKALTMVGICYGLAAADPATRIFDESVQQLVLVVLLLLGIPG